ncbi:MAG: SIS domain-containing protein [Candidatus Sumerlaeota bacterium]|nr:SIS domain-containing protein [Candidatus Sumerlaeota bacterium]
MNALDELLSLPAAEKKRLGVEYTPPEIAQQPAVWVKAADKIVRNRQRIHDFLVSAGALGDREAVVILTGAGTSEFIGNSIAYALRRGLRREVISVPTTHLVTHAATTLVPGHPYVVISFARSGNSPESLATFERVRRLAPSARQMVITCNKDGALAKAARADGQSLVLELPEETNDQSLAMTSSFSTMALAGVGLCFLDAPEAFHDLAVRLGEGATRVLRGYGDVVRDFAGLPFHRACFLGSNTLFGTMQECHLKMQEMTAGQVACRFDSYLGLRHGPQVFVNAECVVVAALASDPRVRRYEIDMLRELQAKRQGCGTLLICDRADAELRGLASAVIELFPDGNPVADEHRVMTDVVVGQMLAVFKSLACGLKPDDPTPGGTIHRVVQGVAIYEP